MKGITRFLSLAMLSSLGSMATLTAADAPKQIIPRSSSLQRGVLPSKPQAVAPVKVKRPDKPQPNVAPGKTLEAEAFLPGRDDRRAAGADDKTGTTAAATRQVQPNAFPASIEALKKDRTLTASDFRLRQPSTAEINRLTAEAASGPVRVIVTLKMLLTPEGLLGEHNAAEQRSIISLIEQRVLSDLRPQLSSGAMQLLRQFEVVPMLVFIANAEALRALATHVDVAAIQEDGLSAPTLNASAPAMGSADALDRGFSGSGWNVAVLDTGIDRSHQFLRGFVGEACFSGNNNCPNGSTSQVGIGAAAACTYAGACFHGTHVSGIAIGASQTGLTNREGAARNANLIPVQVFSRFTDSNCNGDENPCARAYYSDMMAGLQHIYNLRNSFAIAAVNMSIGGGVNAVNCDGNSLKPIIDMLRSVNIATVISSGNNGSFNAVSAPACISSAISVGATDNVGNVAGFSNIGNANLVDLVAPGVSVASSCPYSMYASGFCIASGTSMAAPHVAGAFAVMQSQANQTVAFNEGRLETQALTRRDNRSGGIETNLRGVDVFDALANVNNLTLIADDPESSYRTPRPILHTFNYSTNRRFWSVAALRQSTGIDVDMSQCSGTYVAGCPPLASSADGLQGGIGTDLIVTDHNDGRRPLPDVLGLGFNQFSSSSFAAPNDGRYDVQVSDPAEILLDTARYFFDDRNFVRVYDSLAFAGIRRYLRAEATTDFELYVFESNPADPSTFAGGTSSAVAKGTTLSNFFSFVPSLTSYVGIVIVNRGGSGEVTLYSDDSAPVGSVVINDGAASTTTPNVTLTLAADDPETGILDMRVASDGLLDTEAWEPYATSKAVTLPQTTGAATVAAQFRNRAGQISDPVTDSITIQATPVVLNIADVSVVEGNSGTSIANVTVSLTASSTSSVTARFSTSNGTATAGTDYVNRLNGTVTFAPGQTERVLAFTINGDATFEPNETFFVTLSGPVGATIGDGQGVVTIVNDDAAPFPVLSVADVFVAEGNSGTIPASVTISLSAPSTERVSVRLTTSNNTATAGSDYRALNGVITFAPDQTTRVVTLNIIGDTTVEPDETLFVTLSEPVGATIGDGQGLVTITNDDAALSTLTINDTSVAEGNTGTRNAVFTVRLSAVATGPVTVAFATANDTAIAGSDYVATSGTVSIPAGALTGVINVPVNGDTLTEPNETFFVNLSAPSGATLADAQGVGTISTDDVAALPTLTINDTSIAEGNAGTRNAVFTVTQSAVASGPVTVSFVTANGTAVAGSDYVAASGTVTIPAGALSGVINVPVNGDTLSEPNETFFVNLSAPGGATLADAQGIGTISNDDPAATTPGIGVNVSSFNFGNAPVGGSSAQRMLIITSTGTAPLSITSIRLTGDYVGSSGCPPTLAPGATCALTGSFRPTAAGARPGSVTINSNAPTSPTVVQLMGTGTAATPAASLSIDDVSLGETDAQGNPSIATFTVRLSAAASGTVSVNYTTADGTATGGRDYIPTSGTLTFTAGQMTRTFTVSVIDSSDGEPHETFSVALSNITGSATIGDGIGVATIIDDDFNDSGRPVDISDAVVTEGPNGQRQAVFYVAGPNDEADFFYSTSGGTATPGVDYMPVNLATAGNGDSNHVSTITINILGDTISEPDETFFLTVTSADGTVLGQARATIVNDDQLPFATSFSIADAAVQPFPEFPDEGDTSQATLVVTRTGSVMFSQTVVVETQDGTAVAGAGYVPFSMTLSFAPGESAKIVTVTAKPPGSRGGDFFYVNLRNASNANIIDRQAVVAKDELT